jgi:bifunctional oligoribonuclease and PAP phosphatase NrnA
VGISTDTGSFQFDSVTPRTYEIGAQVMRMGVDIAEINRQTYANYPLRRVTLLRGLLNEMQITHQGQVASWVLRRSLVESTNALPDDSEGLIDTLRSIQGVKVAVHFEEMLDGKVRISIRSQDPAIDVGQIVAKFGGGGHTLAAGARMAGPVEEARQRLFHAITEAL